MIRRGPLAGRYPAAAAMVVFALVPYLVLSSALGPLSRIIAASLHMSPQEMSLGVGVANAAYAVGTILAVQLALRLPQRRLFVAYAALLLIGSVLAAAARNPGMFIAGHVLQGFSTSLLLIAAVPPLIVGYPLSRMRPTAVIMNLGVFGAVALGPTLGGIQANADAWRPLFWCVAAVSLAALVLSLLTFQDTPPVDRGAPWDPVAIALAAGGALAAFIGASELLTHRFLAAGTFGLLIAGVVLIGSLVVNQYRSKKPLLCFRLLLSTVPMSAVVVVVCASVASISATALTASLLARRYKPLHVGLLFTPELGAALLTAVVFGAVFTKRQVHFLPVAAMLSLCAGLGVLLIGVPPSQAATLVGSGLVGIGVGASVVPAQFAAGFSLQARNIQPVFAIVALLRSLAGFMMAPVLAHFAATVGGSLESGTRIALWIGLVVAVLGAVVPVLLYLAGGAQPQAPDLELFVSGKAPAWESPPLLARLRAGRSGSAKAAGQPTRT